MVKVKVTMRTSWPYVRNTHLAPRNESDRRPARHFPCREMRSAEAASWTGENGKLSSEGRESADGSTARSVRPCQKRFQVHSCRCFFFFHKAQITLVTTVLRFSRKFGWELRPSLTSKAVPSYHTESITSDMASYPRRKESSNTVLLACN